ncbi:MAG: single-stranded-DNA-specific exonuclease RecJ [Candidatus Eremiobacteraeota bacterium]|nr:single-stranded-DNA-specific exonuclease RecJ [Candidatus Eremiobacteraeota bacterium]
MISLSLKESSAWRVSPRENDCEKWLSEELEVSVLTARLLLSRGFSDPSPARSFLFGTLDDRHDPLLLSGMLRAIDVIRGALRDGKPIRILGDYDVDGVTSTALLLQFLRRLGACVDYYIPHRVNDGYGVSAEAIEQARRDGISLIVTVDCGMAAHREIGLAKSLGISTVVIDHHEVPPVLPEAEAIINARQPCCAFPFKELAGVGLAFKFIEALSLDMSLPFPRDFLGLVALGTIADVVPLVGENRILVREGMKVLASSEAAGIKELLKAALRKQAGLTVKDIAFKVAPRINAAGRMGRASRAVELLTCEDSAEAGGIVHELDTLNRERQKVEERIRKELFLSLEKMPRLLEDEVLVMESDTWHPGVIGITAARLSEFTGKPVFLIALSGDTGRGSARAFNSHNIYELLSNASDLFREYGGHRSAGGFTIKREDIPALKERLREAPDRAVKERPCHSADCEVSLDELDMVSVRELELFEPFGEKNPPPLLIARGMRIGDMRCVGGGSHLKLHLRQGEVSVKAIAFKKARLLPLLLKSEVLYDMVVTPELESFQGRRAVSLKVEDILYPDRNSHLICREPREFFSGPWGRGAPGGEKGPLLINSRNVMEKTGYVREIIRYALSGLILVRTPRQKTALEQKLKREGIIPRTDGKILAVMSFLEQREECSPVEDIVLFSPPPSFSHFSHRWFRNARRVHFLFSDEEIAYEMSIQDLVIPSVEMLVRIQGALHHMSSRNLFQDRLEAVVEKLGDEKIRKVTLEVALKILSELRLVEKDSDGYRLCNGEELTEEGLIESRYFSSLVRQRDSFLRFRDLYREDFELCKREILARIGDS